MTIGKHLELAKQMGEDPPLLRERLGVPPRTAHVWEWFRLVCRGRQRTDSGEPQPITYSEIEAWARLCDIQIRAFEVHLLKALDMLYLNQE